MNVYELLGFFIGDGHIFYSKYHRKYKLEFNGNVEEDYDYFVQIYNFLKTKSDNLPRMFTWYSGNGKVLRLELYDKIFIEKLMSLGFLRGKKTFTIEIPKSVRGKKLVSLVRGLFEADGCLYFSRSKIGKYPSYPRIEIKTSSKILLSQLKAFFISFGFNYYTRKSTSDRTPAIGVSGVINLEKWRRLIGFVSLKNKTKYGFWKTKGFYIPHIPLKKRLRYAHVA